MLHHPLPYAVLLATLCVVVPWELKRRSVPWWVSGVGGALALVARWVEGGWGELDGRGVLGGALGAATTATVLGLVAWWGRGFGAADVVLFAAVGAVFGFPLCAAALVFVSLVGALQALATVGWRRGVAARRGPSAPDAAVDGALAARIPYAVSVALGCAWTVWWSGS